MEVLGGDAGSTSGVWDPRFLSFKTLDAAPYGCQHPKLLLDVAPEVGDLLRQSRAASEEEHRSTSTRVLVVQSRAGEHLLDEAEVVVGPRVVRVSCCLHGVRALHWPLQQRMTPVDLAIEGLLDFGPGTKKRDIAHTANGMTST